MSTEVARPPVHPPRADAMLRRAVFGIPARETSCARRGFVVEDAALCAHLERIGETFVYGYHAALLRGGPAGLGEVLQAVPPAWRGFAFEGAAMALALMDQLTPWRRWRLAAFLDGPGADHCYMIYVGAGWAYARLCRSLERPLARLDPLLRWLAIDGYGFHEGYFAWRHYLQPARPTRFAGYAARVFDQGLGRSLWFSQGADVERIGHVIGGFVTERHADLWSGVGLACGYAGGSTTSVVERMLVVAGNQRPALAQGVAFAAKARQRAGNLLAETEAICQQVWGRPAAAVAAITDRALIDLAPTAAAPAYAIWRQRIAAVYAKEGV